MSATKEFKSFEEFYPYYLEEHSNRTNRRLHFVGTSAGLLVVLYGLSTLNPATIGWSLLVALFIGYGMAWIGHFVFEKNKPATFQYPWMSYKGDWRMWWETLTGKIRF
jgi:hypothetical protein